MLLGMSQGNASLALGVRVFLEDKFSGPTRNLTAALKGYKNEFMSFQENLRVARNITMGVAAGGLLLVRSMSRAVSEGAQFLYTMEGVHAITDAVASKMHEVSKLAIKLGRQTMFTPQQVASGMRFMAMAGQTANQIISSMPAATALAGATMTALGGKMGSADILTNALKAFGWQAKNSAQMADILTAAATNSNVSLVDVGNSIRYVAATARNLNIPVQNVTATIMALGNAGIQATMSGTALENAYRYLSNSLSQFATSKVRKTWAMLGMTKSQLMTAKGDLIPFVSVLQKIKEHLKGFGSVDTQNILKNIFGVRGQRAGATLLKNLDQVRRFQNLLTSKQIEGTAQRKLNLMMNSVEGHMLKLTSAMSGLRAAFTSAIGPTLKSVLHILTNIVGAFAHILDSPMGRYLANVGTVLVALITPIAGLTAIITSLSYAIRSLNVTFAGMKASMGFMGPMIFGGSNSYMREASMVSASTGTLSRYGKEVGVLRNAKGQFASKAQILAIGRNTGALSKASKEVGLLGKLGRGALSFLTGPVGIAITAISFLLPLAFDLFSSNTKATEENTKALLKDTEHLSTLRDLYMALSNKTVADAVDLIREHLEEAYRENKISVEQVKKLLSEGNEINLTKYSIGDTGKPITEYLPNF